MNETQEKAIIKHGEDLKRFFRLDKEIDPMKLCKTLRRIETSTHKLMTDRCNGESNEAEIDIISNDNDILNKVDDLLNFRENMIPVFINGDARGYALKVEDDFMRKIRDSKGSVLGSIHSDMGGYGIIAPDLTGD